MMEGRWAEVVPGATTAPVLVGMNHLVVDTAALERCDCGEEVWKISVDLHREELELELELVKVVATCWWCGRVQNNDIVLQQDPLTDWSMKAVARTEGSVDMSSIKDRMALESEISAEPSDEADDMS